MCQTSCNLWYETRVKDLVVYEDVITGAGGGGIEQEWRAQTRVIDLVVGDDFINITGAGGGGIEQEWCPETREGDYCQD